MGLFVKHETQILRAKKTPADGVVTVMVPKGRLVYVYSQVQRSCGSGEMHAQKLLTLSAGIKNGCSYRAF